MSHMTPSINLMAKQFVLRVGAAVISEVGAGQKRTGSAALTVTPGTDFGSEIWGSQSLQHYLYFIAMLMFCLN